jgi:polyisoprenoid-binding protein YceI
MKNLIVLTLITMAAFSFKNNTSFQVDSAGSKVIWTASKVTGTHTGNVQIKSGELKMDGGKLTGGSFDIDMNSITCTDLEGEWRDKLVGHLKSPDFFGTEKFPIARLVISRVIPIDTKGNYKVIGNITIKEITKEIRFNTKVSEAGGKPSATAKITLDRTDFDVRFGSGSFFDNLGDKTIYDEFDLQIALAVK